MVMKAEESPGPRLTALQRGQKTVFQVRRGHAATVNRDKLLQPIEARLSGG